MVVNSYKPYLLIVRHIQWSLLFAAAYVGAICWLDLQFHFEQYNFPVAIVAILGTVIGLLLAFRTNSAYDRWWEARILWGAIVNDSRTWVRQLLAFCQAGPKNGVPTNAVRQMAYRQIAWCFALCRSLRDDVATKEAAEFLDPGEVESYQMIRHVPNAMLLRQGRELRQLYEEGALELFQFVELERTLMRLTDSMGGCERIKNTVFPKSYSAMVHGLIFIFVVFLPFGLVNVPAVGLIATSLSLAFTFLVIDRVSTYLQDPFSNRPSDTPMLSLSRTIEVNIKQMLDESEVPRPLEAVDGILY